MLKPNIVAPKKPELAATTHPAVVKAVAKAALEAGGQVRVGDSSGGIIAGNYPTARSFKVSGIEDVCRDLGIEMVNFDTAGTRRVPIRGRFLKEIDIAKPVLDADVIINLPKLKTNSAHLFTGAVKNQFGMVPGTRKARYHAEAPASAEFSALLVDICQSFPPRLSIMDGIVGMEGNGPTSGTPHSVGILAGAENSALLDALCCRMIHIKPDQVGHLREAAQRGLCAEDFKYILLGDLIHFPLIQDYKLPGNLILKYGSSD